MFTARLIGGPLDGGVLEVPAGVTTPPGILECQVGQGPAHVYERQRTVRGSSNVVWEYRSRGDQL